MIYFLAIGLLLAGFLGGAVARIVTECHNTGETFGEVVASLFSQWTR